MWCYYVRPKNQFYSISNKNVKCKSKFIFCHFMDAINLAEFSR